MSTPGTEFTAAEPFHLWVHGLFPWGLNSNTSEVEVRKRLGWVGTAWTASPLGRGQPEQQPAAISKRALWQWPPSFPGFQQGCEPRRQQPESHSHLASAHQDWPWVLSHHTLKVTSAPRQPIWLAKDGTKRRWISKRCQVWKKGKKIWTKRRKGNMEQSNLLLFIHVMFWHTS